MNKFFRGLAFWLVIIIIVVALFNISNFRPSRSVPKDIIFSEFILAVEENRVAEVTISERNIRGKFTDGTTFTTYAPDYPDLTKDLLSKGVKIVAKPRENPIWLGLLINALPWLMGIGLWIFFLRQMQAGGNKALSFGRSRAKLHMEGKTKVTFADVAGVEEAKEELKEIIEFLKDPQKFQRLGGKIPKGVLLVGPPGSGKTLLAKAVAGEAGVPFFSISGSDFVEMFVGVGASRVRDLFEQGKRNAPCIVFIDELDAVGRHRGAGLGGGHDEREQTLNQLLVEMDGFDTTEGVILMAATNRPDVLDPALLRSGRFDRQVVVDNPDVVGREGILKVHTKNVPLAPDVDLKVIGRGTPGLSGADLANLVNEAALLAAKRGKKYVNMTELEEAKDKVLMGAERRSRVISEKEKRTTAYHEAGHALVAKLIPGADPVHKATIIPRGRSMGVTSFLPLEDRYNRSRSEFLTDITCLLGGRVAEEITFNEITTGAANDLERATDIAHMMVTRFGMSDKLGPRTFGKRDEEIFLGRDFLREKNYSEATAQEIDREVKNIIEQCYQRARRLVEENHHLLINLAETLLEKEVLDGESINKILQEAEQQKPSSAPKATVKIN